MIPRIRPVESNSIAAIGYDERTRKAFVRFRSAPRVYVYSGVPRQVIDALWEAESKGRFVNEVIKPGYPVRRL